MTVSAKLAQRHSVRQRIALAAFVQDGPRVRSQAAAGKVPGNVDKTCPLENESKGGGRVHGKDLARALRDRRPSFFHSKK